MKKVTLILLLLLLAQMLIAQEAILADGQAEGMSGITASSELILQTSTLPELQLQFVHRLSIPFLQGNTPFTEGNNIELDFGAEIAPVKLNVFTEVVWTPITFFQLDAGGSIGSGWNIEIFGEEVRGIGLNRANADGESEYSGSAFDGLLWQTHIGVALQGDLAAVFPGDWNHLVVRSYHQIKYKGYTRAAAGESWYIENDDGENVNGFNYYGNFLIGYQMPIFIDFVALLAEADLYLYDTPNRSQWGDDKIRWTFSNIINFTFIEQFSVTMITQFRTQRNYLEANWDDLYYRNRTIDNSNPLSFEFYRIAVALTYKF